MACSIDMFSFRRIYPSYDREAPRFSKPKKCVSQNIMIMWLRNEKFRNRGCVFHHYLLVAAALKGKYGYMLLAALFVLPGKICCFGTWAMILILVPSRNGLEHLEKQRIIFGPWPGSIHNPTKINLYRNNLQMEPGVHRHCLNFHISHYISL